jgi:hypothetical protein
MGDLSERMDAGISTSGTCHFRDRTHHVGQAILQCPLHRSFVRLDLPSGKGRAVVFENKFDAFQENSKKYV